MYGYPSRPHKIYTDLPLQHDDRQLDEQLHHFQLCLDVTRQRMYEKNVIIQNLQENFSRERNAMAHVISTLKSELAAERQKGRETREREDERWDEETISAPCESGAQSYQLEGCSDPTEGNDGQQPEAGFSSAPHQTSEPELHREQVKTLVQRRLGNTVLRNPMVVVTQSCESDQTVVQSVEHVPERGKRKRARRALRSDDC